MNEVPTASYKVGETAVLFQARCPNCNDGLVIYKVRYSSLLLRKFFTPPNMVTLGVDSLHQALAKRRRLVCPCCGQDNTYTTLDFELKDILWSEIDNVGAGEKFESLTAEPPADWNPTVVDTVAPPEMDSREQVVDDEPPITVEPEPQPEAAPETEKAPVAEPEPIVKKTAKKKKATESAV